MIAPNAGLKEIELGQPSTPKQDWEVDGTMEKAQRDALRQALERNHFSPTRAAASLHVGRATVYRMMARYQIGAPNDCGSEELSENRSRPAALTVVAHKTAEFTYSKLARALLVARERADLHFAGLAIDGSGLDIMLHLYAAEAEGVVVNAMSCKRVLRSTFPKAARRLAKLAKSSLVTISENPADRRGPIATLTPAARMQIATYLEDVL